MFEVRGEYVGLVYLKNAFNISGAVSDPTKGLVVLAETEHKGKLGVVVDALLGQQQVVIKSLETNYDPVAGISAATILGNGMVAPIVDVDGLRRMSAIPDAVQAPPNSNSNELEETEIDDAADLPAEVNGSVVTGEIEKTTAMEQSSWN